MSQVLQTANTTKKCRLGAHRAPINKLGIDYHQYRSSSYLVYIDKAVPPSPSAMEIKLELDTDKTAKAAVAIAAAYALCRVSHSTDSPQLAAANAFALIVIVAILYGPRPAPKKSA